MTETMTKDDIVCPICGNKGYIEYSSGDSFGGDRQPSRATCKLCELRQQALDGNHRAVETILRWLDDDPDIDPDAKEELRRITRGQ